MKGKYEFTLLILIRKVLVSFQSGAAQATTGGIIF